MSTFIHLPTPLSQDSIAPGQLISDPFTGQAISNLPSDTTCRPTYIYSKHQTITTQDTHGHRHPTTSAAQQSERKDSVMLSAEESTQISLAQPRTFFDALQQDNHTHVFLREAALQHQLIYYVTGVQTLISPSPERVVVDEGIVAEVSEGATRLPMHVRRPASASHMSKTNGDTGKTDKSLIAVELSRVKCHVGAANEPHELDDMDYDWTYHVMEDGLQLSIGLGKAMKASKARDLDDSNHNENSTDNSWDSQSEYDDDSGLGGF